MSAQATRPGKLRAADQPGKEPFPANAAGIRPQVVWPITALDSIRGLAALGVALAHFSQQAMPLREMGWIGMWIYQLGTWGVTVFFILSGFCIHGARLKEESLGNTGSWPAFFWRRFFRIYPGLFVSALVCLLLAQYWRTDLVRNPSLEALLGHLLLFSNFTPFDRCSINGVLWSVVVECHFYFLYPLFLWLGRQHGMLRTVAAITLGGAIYLVMVSFLSSPGDTRVMWQYTFPAIWWKWCLGALLADVYWGPERDWWVRWATRGWVCGTSLAASFLAAFLTNNTAVLTFQRFVLPLIMGVFVISVAERKGSMLEQPIFRWLGKISYSIYLFHPVVLVGASLLTLGSWQRDLGLFLGGTVLVGAVGFYLVEQPMMQWGRARVDCVPAAGQWRPRPRPNASSG